MVMKTLIALVLFFVGIGALDGSTVARHPLHAKLMAPETGARTGPCSCLIVSSAGPGVAWSVTDTAPPAPGACTEQPDCEPKVKEGCVINSAITFATPAGCNANIEIHEASGITLVPGSAVGLVSKMIECGGSLTVKAFCGMQERGSYTWTCKECAP